MTCVFVRARVRVCTWQAHRREFVCSTYVARRTHPSRRLPLSIPDRSLARSPLLSPCACVSSLSCLDSPLSGAARRFFVCAASDFFKVPNRGPLARLLSLVARTHPHARSFHTLDQIHHDACHGRSRRRRAHRHAPTIPPPPCSHISSMIAHGSTSAAT